MHPHALSVLGERGLDGTAFRSRALTPEMVERSDLVLTATRAQRGLCVEAAPASVGRVFTLRQFGRLAALAEPASPDGLFRAIAIARATLQPVPPDEDDLADPIGLDLPAFRETANVVEAALAPILRLIVNA